jgi:phage FluMu protein Com
MQKTIRCTACNKPFEAVGQGTMREVAEGVTCPYCHTPNEVSWPMDGAVFARAIPAWLEGSSASNPRFEPR